MFLHVSPGTLLRTVESDSIDWPVPLHLIDLRQDARVALSNDPHLFIILIEIELLTDHSPWHEPIVDLSHSSIEQLTCSSRLKVRADLIQVGFHTAHSGHLRASLGMVIGMLGACSHLTKGDPRASGFGCGSFREDTLRAVVDHESRGGLVIQLRHALANGRALFLHLEVVANSVLLQRGIIIEDATSIIAVFRDTPVLFLTNLLSCKLEILR